MWNPSTPVTGAAQTSFTTPTYTLTVDTAPTIFGKQHYVSALGGTQAGVNTHSVSAPFTHMFVKPAVLKTLGNPNPVTGRLPSVPNNTYQLITRKGVVPLAGQPARTMIIRTIIDVPAGADSYDIANVRAALSSHIGLLNQQSSGVGDTANTGSM